TDDVSYEPLGGSEEVWSNDRGQLRFKRLADGVIVTEVRGTLSRAFVPGYLRSLERVLAARPGLLSFCDWYDMEGYDSDARMALTQWTYAHRSEFAAIHILLRSKLVAMGVSVANLALGGFMTVHSARAPFDRAMGA